MTAGAILVCNDCGAELPASFLACPRCGRLVHAETLKNLAAQGERAEQDRHLGRALAAWREALSLLPGGSSQFDRVQAKVEALSAQVPAGGLPVDAPKAANAKAGAPRSGLAKWAAGAGALGVVLLKFKWVILFVLAKGKLLLVGLTQAKTFLTMALALGAYATLYGWQFALGLVVSIYIHEMGHVAWLRRYGIAATAPMFIPGVGAFVRLKQRPATVGEDARVGLAGPIWGAGAAVAALALGAALHQPILIAIARVGAWINLFNLVPLWQLDGGRGFAALTRRQRGLVAGVLWLLAISGVDGVLFILAIAATFRAASKATDPPKGDRAVLMTYLVLVAGLTALIAGVGKLPSVPF